MFAFHLDFRNTSFRSMYQNKFGNLRKIVQKQSLKLLRITSIIYIESVKFTHRVFQGLIISDVIKMSCKFYIFMKTLTFDRHH